MIAINIFMKTIILIKEAKMNIPHKNLESGFTDDPYLSYANSPLLNK